MVQGVFVEAINVVKYYGAAKVLDGVNLRIDKPVIYSLLGPNGLARQLSSVF